MQYNAPRRVRQDVLRHPLSMPRRAPALACHVAMILAIHQPQGIHEVALSPAVGRAVREQRLGDDRRSGVGGLVGPRHERRGT